MKIGYARVSTTDQTLNLQLDALQKAGCDKIFQEKKSGTVSERPELDKMLGISKHLGKIFHGLLAIA